MNCEQQKKKRKQQKRKIRLSKNGKSAIMISGIFIFLFSFSMCVCVLATNNSEVYTEAKPTYSDSDTGVKTEKRKETQTNKKNKRAKSVIKNKAKTKKMTKANTYSAEKVSKGNTYSMEKVSKTNTYSDNDLYYLAAAVCREAGGVSEEIQLLVANVIINRVNSKLYPNTIYKVLTQYKQYGTMWRDGISFPGWATSEVKANCYSVAKRILGGERVCPENVLFQAEFKQGNRIYKYFDEGYYFCYYGN